MDEPVHALLQVIRQLLEGVDGVVDVLGGLEVAPKAHLPNHIEALPLQPTIVLQPSWLLTDCPQSNTASALESVFGVLKASKLYMPTPKPKLRYTLQLSLYAHCQTSLPLENLLPLVADRLAQAWHAISHKIDN